MIDRTTIEDAVEHGVIRAFERLGVDAKEFRETQADFGFLRRQRLRSETVVSKVMTAAVGLTVAGMLYSVWESAAKFVR